MLRDGEKSVVYVNTRAASIDLCREMRKRLPALAGGIVFYNAALDHATRSALAGAFRSGEVFAVIATSAFGEGIDVPDVRRVVLYSLPFSLVEYNQMAGRSGRDHQESAVCLLFGEGDSAANEAVLGSVAPKRRELEGVYRELSSYASSLGAPGSAFAASDADILWAVKKTDAGSLLTERGVASALAIFEELGLVSTSGGAQGEAQGGPPGEAQGGARRMVKVALGAKKVELEGSIRYREGREDLFSFKEFESWALGAAPEEMLASFTRPMLPEALIEGKGGQHGR
jgi:single-stranded-DNA-specific exonuclease